MTENNSEPLGGETAVETPAPARPQIRIFRLNVELLTKTKPLNFELGKGGCTLIAETPDGYVVGYSDGSGCVIPRTAVAFVDFVVIPAEHAQEILKNVVAPTPAFKGDNVVSFAEASQKKNRKRS